MGRRRTEKLKFGLVNKAKRSASGVESLLSLLGGVVLFGWGVIKLSVARASCTMMRGHGHDACRSFMRLNIPLMAAGLFLQHKGAMRSLLPGVGTRMQTVLVGLYACIGLGLNGIPRPGPDRFPDLFMDYLPERRYYMA